MRVGQDLKRSAAAASERPAGVIVRRGRTGNGVRVAVRRARPALRQRRDNPGV